MGSYSRKRYATESASFPKSANSAPGSYSYATFADLPASGSTPGNTAFVVATNRLYIWSGVGWYLIATVTNASPTAITGVDGAYTLAIDGTATTITAVSTDPEGFTLTWSYAVSSGSLGSTATVSQADNVFTITPSTNSAHEGTFSLTFSVTDGINGVVSAVSSFTLSFSITNSRYTSLSVKAVAAGSNQTFDDASASNNTITVAGNSTTSTFSPHRHGGYSTYLGTQTSRYYSPSSSDFDIGGTGNWSYEAWVYADNQTFPSYTRVFGLGPFYNDPKSFGVQIKDADNSNNITVYWDDAAGLGRKLISSTAFSQEVWHHLLVCRSGNDIALFLDGTRIAHNSSYTSSIDTGNTYLFVGHSGYGTEGFTGYIRDVRFINGSHPYDASSSSITVPTEPLTVVTNTKFLQGQLPYFKDQSTSNHAITVSGTVSSKPKSVFDNGLYSEAVHGASVYFDGDGDYIDLNGDAGFAFGTNDFTVEFWLYPLTRPSNECTICDFRGVSQNSTHTLLYIDSQYNTNNIIYYTQGGGRITSSVITDNTWTHVALVRQGYYVRLFVNGQQQGSTFTNSLSQLVGTNRPRFGGSGYVTTASGSNGHNLKAYMSDIRVLNGTCAYFSNFTPPTSPLTTTPPVFNINVTNSGASAYTLTSDTLSTDMSSSNPTVNMAVGQTVNFVVNASGHPFHIRVSDGGADVSTPAATNQGTQSGTVTWTPNTAGTYYYQCSVHSGMIGTINVTESAKLLLNPETSISDLSQSSEITCFGDAAISTTQVKFAGTKSIYLDGTGDYLQISNYEDSWISGYTGDYTIEFWWYPTNVSAGSYQEILTAGNGFQLYIASGGALNLAVDNANSTSYFWHPQSIHTMVNNTWQHLAIVRNGNVYTIYVDGVSKATTTTSTLIGTGTNFVQLGILAGSLYPTPGYFQDLRITKGLARYTSNFTPSTAELEG